MHRRDSSNRKRSDSARPSFRYTIEFELESTTCTKNRSLKVVFKPQLREFSSTNSRVCIIFRQENSVTLLRVIVMWTKTFLVCTGCIKQDKPNSARCSLTGCEVLLCFSTCVYSSWRFTSKYSYVSHLTTYTDFNWQNKSEQIQYLQNIVCSSEETSLLCHRGGVDSPHNLYDYWLC